MFARKLPYNLVLIILIVLENLFLFYFYQAGIFSQAVNSTGLIFTSLLIGVLPIAKYYKQRVEIPAILKKHSRKYLLLLVYAAGIIWLNMITIMLIKEQPIDIGFSDILPAIQLIVKAFLSGQNPYSYTALSSIGYSTPTGYLPAHWMPFAIAEYFHFDYRTISFAIWCIGVSFLLVRSIKLQNIWLNLSVPFLLFGSYYIMLQLGYGIIGETVEIMIAGYYMLFIIGINQKNVFLTAIFITLCLLSRYVVALWLPLFAFVLFVSGYRKDLYKIILIVLVLVCALYIIPFLSKDWTTLTVAHKHNYEELMGEWYHLNNKHLPIHLYNGIGLAYLFYEKYQTNLPYGNKLIKEIFFISTSGIILVMAAWYWFNRNKIHYKIFLMASFKIYLCILFSLLHTPYLYLFITANFVSIAIFAEQARYRIIK